WALVGTQTGATHISMRTLEFDPGASPALFAGNWDDVWYVIAGHSELILDGERHALRPQTGIYLRPGAQAALEVHGPEPLLVSSCRCPDPGSDVHAETMQETPAHTHLGPTASAASARRELAAPRPLAHLSECEPEQTEDDRWFRVLVDARLGCEQVTQFVGCI